jgi:hypothetical protein
MSLIFLHNDIPDIGMFKSSIKPIHTVIDYNSSITDTDVLNLIGNRTNIAFVYHFPGYFSVPFFKELHNTKNISKKFYFSNRLLDLFDLIKKQNGSLVIDLLSCNLNDIGFIKEVSDIKNELGINIRYSIDLTGNKNGNWTLESDNVDIKDYYFTENINNWNYVLSGAVSLVNFARYNPSAFTYNTTTKTCTLLRDISMSDMYFSTTQKFTNSGNYIDLTSNEIFNGNGHKITIEWINSGLFSSSSTSFSKAPLIKNLTVDTTPYVINGGGIVRNEQRYFRVDNCVSHGIISICSGGICGEGVGANNVVNNKGKCIISNCYSTGEIHSFAGGICGPSVGIYGGECIIQNCYSTGNIIGDDAGGICGAYAGSLSFPDSSAYSKCYIYHCYSIGDISANFIDKIPNFDRTYTSGGGICGSGAGRNNGFCSINFCYSKGNIGYKGGGICGGNIANINGKCIINNCYSIGNIGTNAGGICGPTSGTTENIICLINNCYSIGSISQYAGGIIGYNYNLNSKYYIFNTYCNGRVVGDESSFPSPGNNYGAIYINNKDHPSNYNVSFNLLGITQGIDFNTQDDNNTINLIINDFNPDTNDVYNCKYWNTNSVWIPGGASSTGEYQYPKLLMYNANEFTKKLTIDSRLFIGLNEIESNNARYKLLNNFYIQQLDDNGWYTDASNLGFYGSTYDKLNYKLYNSLIATSFNLNNLITADTGIYINELIAGFIYTIIMGDTTYTIKKIIENPNNKYKLSKENKDYIELYTGDKYTSNTFLIIIDGGIIANSNTINYTNSQTFSSDINGISIKNLVDYNSSVFSYSANTCTLLKDININDISFNNTTQNFSNSTYFIDMSGNEIFDGSGHTITVNWPNNGLFGITNTVKNINNAPLIKNLTVTNTNNIADFGGGIIRPYQKFFKVDNCVSNGNIGSNGGGICGHQCGLNGSFIINNSYSTGAINSYAGGICGHHSGYTGSFTINNCYSKGDIGNEGGGICGQQSGYYGSSNINNCYSMGTIGIEAGGICGKYFGINGINNINNCYSSGNILSGGGGICGSYSGEHNGICTINSCYSTGDISDNAGGICGSYTGYDGNCVINNCYSIGNIGKKAGGMCSTNSAYFQGKCLINNSYSIGSISENAGGICGFEVGGYNGNVYIFNSYCNGKIIGDLDNNGRVYINNKINPIISDISFNLIGITKKIDFNTQDSSDINLDIRGNLYDCTRWDTTNTWISGGISSSNEFQYPQLLIYNTNSFTKNLIINSRLFTGLNEDEKNLARHKLFDKFYSEQSDMNNWFSDASSMGFVGELYDKPYYKLYNTVNTNFHFNNTIDASYGVYINKLLLNIDYTIILGNNTYIIRKISENPNKYRITKSDKSFTIVADGQKYTDNNYLIIFGSITGHTNTVGFINNVVFIFLENPPEIYKNKVFENDGKLQFKWTPINGALYYIVNRFYGICTKPETSTKVTNTLYTDDNWNKTMKIIRYNVEAVFSNKIKTVSNKVTYYNN